MMAPDNLIDDLQAFGFSAIEAKVYLALIEQNAPLTGYQVAKVASIPRPNVYPALKRLVQRGACLEIPEDGTVRYVSVPFRTLGRSHVQTLSDQVEKLSRLMPQPTSSMVLTRSEGLDALLAHGRSLINGTTASLDVGSSVGLVTLFEFELAQSRERGVSQRYLCFDNCPGQGCGLCVQPLAITLGNFHETGWLAMVSDHRQAFIATGYPDHPQTVLTTMEPIIFSLDMLINLRQAVSTS